MLNLLKELKLRLLKKFLKEEGKLAIIKIVRIVDSVTIKKIKKTKNLFFPTPKKFFKRQSKGIWVPTTTLKELWRIY
jgi:hypothetical protein|tara:strand:- start:188 stop:418 length:231 start_codon:yes stop_codon:yes gene_type:complete